MLIKLDCREIKLKELCQLHLAEHNDKIKMTIESLPLGDIIICDDNGLEKVIIERKSLVDLAASIRDGRYSEQGYRLKQCDLHNHQIYYVIEGDLRYYKPYKGLPDKKALLSAMVSISYFKGFSLYRTNNLEETAEWIVHFAAKLLKEGPAALPYYTIKTSGDSTEPHEESYSQVIGKRIKRDNITPENIGEIMLSQIPSVSSASAIVIMQKFSNLSALITALQNDPKCLNDITSENKNGQAKRLTKPCINNIYNFLIKPTNISVET
jgi:ERCC4-type nuclease